MLNSVRFQPEARLLADIFTRYGLEDILRHHEESGESGSVYELVLASALRLTPVLAPRLCRLFAETRAVLEFQEPVELFVEQDSAVNAWCVHSPGEDVPHLVVLTSGLVERMDDQELRFVLGHELGHLHFRHYRVRMLHAAVGRDEEGELKMPPMLQRRVAQWDRLAELSADRAGFAATAALEPIVSAFFKIASGLGPEHLHFDVEAFLSQLADLQALRRRDLLSAFSHPATPVRVRALQIFAQHRVAGDHGELASIDVEVEELARLMDFEVSEPLQIEARDFLLAGGLLAACSDGDGISEEESDTINLLLLPFVQDPEAAVARVQTTEEAQSLLLKSAAWLRENAGEERFFLFKQLAHVVALDGQLRGNENAFMLEVAELLGIPPKVATASIYEVMGSYLQGKSRTQQRARSLR